MRVLWASHLVPYPPKSGVHLRSYHLLRAVAGKHEVDLVAFVQEQWLRVFYESPTDGLEDCRRQLSGFCHSVRFLKIEGMKRPGGKRRMALEGLVMPTPYSIRWLQGPVARAEFLRAGREGYALAHFDTIGLAPYRPLVNARTASLGHHNIESQMLLRRASNEANALKKAYFFLEGKRLQRYEAREAPQFQVNITCSDLDSERLAAIAPSAQTIAVPNGVDIDYFQPGGAEEPAPSLVFVGSLNWYPNVDAMLYLLREIWPLLRVRFPQLQLHVVGSAPPQQLVSEAARAGGVHVHGFVDDVRPYIRDATVYVCPIRDGGGTKLKLLDAFAMGKCVVAHPIACEGIDAVPGVHVEHAAQPAEFVERIGALLGDPERRNALGRAARELAVRRYSFNRIGESLADAFTALGGPAQP
jgi:glycosyltransferase involved in cell wall biosynthesis